MSIDRREFLVTLLGAAGVATLSQFEFLSPVLAQVQSTTLAADPRRPQFHLLPAANWMNDPNGPIYWNGYYHMFYQYNPNGAIWGDMHWGHAISPDMIHWKHEPVALAPTPGGPDAQGVFSGTAVVRDGRVVVIYTGVRTVPEDQATIKDGVNSFRETQCMATATNPDLKTWEKLPEPVIANPPAGMQVTGFRDPSPWRQDDRWYMVVGSGVPHKGGAVLLYQSRDLRNWEYLHTVAGGEGNGANTANPVDSGDMWECPDFFALGGKHVLIYSAEGKAYWQTGNLDMEAMIFHPEQKGVLDYGSFYAPKTQLDKSGNRILWGWVPETRKVEEYKASGWAGMMSLPRELRVGSDGRLRVSVAEQATGLRGRAQTLTVTSDERKNLAELGKMRIEACCGEIHCLAKVGSEPFGLTLVAARTADRTEDPCVSVSYDPQKKGTISIDNKDLPLSLADHELIEAHLYVDGSVVEVFINNRIACTKRFYYQGGDEREIQLKWEGKTSSIKSLSLWQVSPISANRLTT